MLLGIKRFKVLLRSGQDGGQVARPLLVRWPEAQREHLDRWLFGELRQGRLVVVAFQVPARDARVW